MGGPARSAGAPLPTVAQALTHRDDPQRRAVRRGPGGCWWAGSTRPVRAMRAIGRDPLFIARAEGAHVWDADGNRYVDYLSTWGPAILGHTPRRRC